MKVSPPQFSWLCADHGTKLWHYTDRVRWPFLVNQKLEHVLSVRWYDKTLQIPCGYDPKDPYAIACYYHRSSCGKKEYYIQAFRWFKVAWDQGFEHGALGMGYMYYYGQGVDDSTPKAIEWLRKAIDHNVPAAMEFTFDIYLEGEDDFEADLDEAIHIAEREKKLGLDIHLIHFGQIELKREHYYRASEWFKKAWRKKIPEAAWHLAQMHKNAQGFPKETGSYHWAEWMLKAARAGCSDSRQELQESFKLLPRLPPSIFSRRGFPYRFAPLHLVPPPKPETS